jgi:diacylglycerol O-acyltransferase
LAREAITHDIGRAVGIIRSGLALVPPVAEAIARHPLRTALDVVATASSLGRFVSPGSDTLSPIMTKRGLDRRLDLFEVDLDDLASAGSVVGGTLDDAFVASVTGGLRRYHELHGAPVENLRVTMPIPLHRDGTADGENRIALERFVVPVAGNDPGTRVKTTGWQCRAARYEEALPLSDAVAGILNLLPSGVIGSMFKHVDFLASNIPGVSVPIYLAGSRVSGYYVFGPTTGTAVNVSLVSYQGTGCVGCTIDTAAVPDPDRLVASLRGGFDEVLGLGGAHHPVRPVLADLPA